MCIIIVILVGSSNFMFHVLFHSPLMPIKYPKISHISVCNPLRRNKMSQSNPIYLVIVVYKHMHPKSPLAGVSACEDVVQHLVACRADIDRPDALGWVL